MIKSIDPATQTYELKSPDRKWTSKYAGADFGWGGATRGQVSIWNEEVNAAFPIYQSPSWAKACFSDDSRYFIFLRAGVRNLRFASVTVFDCVSVQIVWTQELEKGSMVELKNDPQAIRINGAPLDLLEGCEFDISNCHVKLN